MDPYDPADPDEIDAAISALVHAVLRSKGKIVFGGHPSIAALVQAASQAYLPASQAERQGLKDRADHPVVMYLSRAFQAHLEPITQWLIDQVWVDVRWIDAVDGETPQFHPHTGLVIDSVAKSLAAMRRAALATDHLIGAVFLGGRIGIVKEFDLLQQLTLQHPAPPATYAFARPGGAAQTLDSRANVGFSSLAQPILQDLGDPLKGGHYPVLAEWIVRDLCVRF